MLAMTRGSRRPRHRMLWLVPIVVALASAWPAAARADEVITSTGPIEALWVGDDLACQASYQAGDTFEFYPPHVVPGDCAALISVDDVLFAPDFRAHSRTATGSLGDPQTFTPQHESVSGSGTAVDPFLITTDVTAANGDIAVQQRTSYVSGQSSYRVDLTVRNESQTQGHAIKAYFAGDCYASGSDIGYGFVRPEIKSLGCSQNPDNSPSARTIQLIPLSPGSASFENYYDTVWAKIGGFGDLDNSCRCGESLDNGVALQWKTTLRSLGTAEFSLQVAFTESQPAPLVDTDGDSLPDSWETGQGMTGDAENLGPLGADPNRKDIFVHADWMAGCMPTAGWDQRAIQMFAKQGIALHIDAGPDSLNANGQPWGSSSRAGEVPFADVTDLRNGWQPLDAAKDLHFVASGRRRAFHYVLFANKIWDDGRIPPDYKGVSRGIPDSDFIVGNCMADPPPAGKEKLPRADGPYFTHELGHNLGLRHGGFEDNNFKPSYFSLMNYGFARWTLQKDGRWIDYSNNVRPAIDETHLDEHAGLVSPVFWFCPGEHQYDSSKYVPALIMYAGVFGDADLDCDGRYGERNVKSNISGDLDFSIQGNPPLFETSLLGVNDWNVIKFTGGGVVGALTLPARSDTPPAGELTGAETQAAIAATAAAAKKQAKQLRVITKTRQLRRPKRTRSTTTIKITVQSLTGRAARDVAIRIRGGQLKLKRGQTKLKTDGRGRATLKVRLRSKTQLQVVATRKGYRTATLYMPVLKR
jgi:hypothetical protein